MQTNFELKRHNTMKIFNAMRALNFASRKELTELTGLSWGSVSTITGELILRGVLVVQKTESAGGRPAEKLALSPDRFLQLGIDINSVGLSFVIVNLRGQIVRSSLLPIVSRKKEALLNALFSETKAILSSVENVIGINLSMQGKINRKTGVSLRTNFFTDWKDVPLVDYFEQRFHLPTKLYHDPDCLLSYHLRNDARLFGKSNGYVVRLDDGIGMARLIDGNIYETGDELSYELGHIVSVPNGRSCPCGKRGCLETYASLRGMRELYAESCQRAQNSFNESLKSNDTAAQQVLKNAAEHLGVALANLFTLSSPEFILLDGVLFSLSPEFFEYVKNNVVFSLNDDCNLLFASYKQEAPAVGACLLTIEKNAGDILFDL